MTDRLTALVALKEAVEVRVIDQSNFTAFNDDLELLWDCFPTVPPPVSDAASNARWAWGGDMNAALSLLAAVLPGWKWQIMGTHSGQNGAMIWREPAAEKFTRTNPDPARALLLAIIAALIEEERNAG